MPVEIKEQVSFLEKTLNRFILSTNEMRYDMAKDTAELKKEMKEFKDEMKEFKEESRRERKEMNIKWGNLANKLGTFAEDIVAPNIPRIAKEYFGETLILDKAVRRDRPNPNDTGQIFEFDAIVVTENYVFLLESKHTVRMKYIEKLLTIIQNFKTAFPEYSKKTLITLFASMYIPENIVKNLTKLGIYAMAMSDDTMDLLNFDQLQNKKNT